MRLMPIPEPVRTDDYERYSLVDLAHIRRQMLRYARSVPPGLQRNQHRRVAAALRNLFKDEAWLLARSL
jgi:hypothetical protein